MEPPPRKERPTINARKLHGLHSDLFHKKHHVEVDILTKIRNYCKQRSQLDYGYGMALQKLKQQYCIDGSDCTGLGFPESSLYACWNRYLNDVSTSGQSYIKMGEFYAQHVAENSKNLLAQKTDSMRKYQDVLNRLHTELSLNVKELERVRKDYVAAYGMYLEMQQKASALQQRLKKNDLGLFESRENVKRDADRYLMRFTELEPNAVDARNWYLLEAASSTAHLKRLLAVDLPWLVQNCEEQVYDHAWTYLSTMHCVESEHYEKMTNDMRTSGVHVTQCAPPKEHTDAFLSVMAKVAMQQLNFQFEPCSQDQETKLVRTAQNSVSLEQEARKLASSVARSQKGIADTQEKLRQLKVLREQSTKLPKNSAGFIDLVRKIDAMEDSLRKAETNKLKADARLELFRYAGYSVDDLIAAAVRSSSVPSLGDSITGGLSVSQRSSRLSLNSDGHDSVGADNTDSSADSPQGQAYFVLYDYQAANEDELSLVKDEILRIYDNPSDVAWPRARNSSGQSGLVPSNYIAVLEQVSLTNQELEETLVPDEPVVTRSPRTTKTSSLPIDVNNIVMYCRANIPYPGNNGDELGFEIDDLLLITDLQPHRTDDGWWRGCNLRTKQVGTFANLLVSEVSQRSLKPQEQSELFGTTTPQLSLPQAAAQQRSTWYGSQSQQITGSQSQVHLAAHVPPLPHRLRPVSSSDQIAIVTPKKSL